MRKPSVWGPPWSTRDATAGISTVYGIPMVLTNASRRSAVRTGWNPDTYAKPALSSSIIRAPE